MFEKDLKARLERIFGIRKTTYDAPDYDAPEQDALFVEIATARSRMSNKAGGRQTAVVDGALIVFSQAERMPYGFFAKRVEQAAPADTRPLIFEREVDLPDSPARKMNLHERRVGFRFLYDSQYDPSRGDLTTLTMDFEMEG